ncbi:MAG TPA: metallophosphoesterase [Planctomycetota bacterium]|nr:metallophosphoesterase [Planctomycetota bacterium]
MEIKLACFADTHGDLPTDIADPEISAWLVAGDVARHGDGKTFCKWARSAGKRIFSVPGNHDSGVFGSNVLGISTINVSGTAQRVSKRIIVAGVGWCTDRSGEYWVLPGEAQLENVCWSASSAVLELQKPGDILVLLTHYAPRVQSLPPYEQKAPGFVYDCIGALIDELAPTVLVHGHTHQWAGRCTRYNDQTLIVCAGPATGILTIDEITKEANFAAAQESI